MNTYPRDSLEYAFAVRMCSERHSAESLSELSSLVSGLCDVRPLLNLWKKWRVYPLAYDSLRLLEFPVKEAEFREVLIDLRKLTILGWAPRRKRLKIVSGRIHTTLKDAGISHVFLRGVEFAERYYLKPELRVSSDIDLLVPEEAYLRAVDAFRESGFSFRKPPHYRTPQAAIVRQMEFLDDELGVTIDLNWRLTGNARIGPISIPVTEVWRQATEVGESEYALANEDALLHIIRHTGHGHDFSDGLVRTCVDVSAILDKAQGQLDWDYIYHQAREAQALRIVLFFAEFYNTFFAREHDPPLTPSFGKRICSKTELVLYSRMLLKRQSVVEAQPDTLWVRLQKGNLGLLARLWGLDRVSGLFRMVRRFLMPSAAEVTLLLEQERKKWKLIERAELYGITMVQMPGIVMGILAFQLSCLLRFTDRR